MTKQEVREWVMSNWSDEYSNLKTAFEDVLAEWSTIEKYIRHTNPTLIYPNQSGTLAKYIENIRFNMSEVRPFVKITGSGERAVMRIAPGGYLHKKDDRFQLFSTPESKGAYSVGSITLHPGVIERVKEIGDVFLLRLYYYLICDAVSKEQETFGLTIKCSDVIAEYANMFVGIERERFDSINLESFRPSLELPGRISPKYNQLPIFAFMDSEGNCIAEMYFGEDDVAVFGTCSRSKMIHRELCLNGLLDGAGPDERAVLGCAVVAGVFPYLGLRIDNIEAHVRYPGFVSSFVRSNYSEVYMCSNLRDLFCALYEFYKAKAREV